MTDAEDLVREAVEQSVSEDKPVTLVMLGQEDLDEVHHVLKLWGERVTQRGPWRNPTHLTATGYDENGFHWTIHVEVSE